MSQDPRPQRPSYAGLGQRTLAFLVDSLVWLGVLIVIAAIIPARAYDDEPVAVGFIYLALLSLAFNYFWLTEWIWGRTFGKAMCNIRVSGEDGRRLRFGPATLRNLSRLLDMIVIGPILIARSERRQRLGDRFAHSVVIRDRPAPAPRLDQLPPPVAPTSLDRLPPPMAPTPMAPTQNPNPTATAPATSAPPRPAPPVSTRKPSPWSRSIGIPDGGWRPITVLWGILAVIGLLTIEAGVVAAFDPELESLASKLAVQGLLAVTLIGVALGFAGLRSSARSALRGLGLRGFAGSAIGLAAVAYIAYVLFAAIYFQLVQPEQEDITRDLGFDERGLGPVLAAVLIVALAPLSEEIFFRGFMFGGLRRRFPLWAAAAISGAVFGLLHYTGPDSIGVVPQLAVLGILLAWLYERTGSLWPPTILHVFNNGIALVIVTST
jgi:membrane protease YdiL (CAAX protease family)/uncharacterized RDD family membrane protein YckC